MDDGDLFHIQRMLNNELKEKKKLEDDQKELETKIKHGKRHPKIEKDIWEREKRDKECKIEKVDKKIKELREQADSASPVKQTCGKRAPSPRRVENKTFNLNLQNKVLVDRKRAASPKQETKQTCNLNPQREVQNYVRNKTDEERLNERNWHVHCQSELIQQREKYEKLLNESKMKEDRLQKKIEELEYQMEEIQDTRIVIKSWLDRQESNNENLYQQIHQKEDERQSLLIKMRRLLQEFDEEIDVHSSVYDDNDKLNECFEKCFQFIRSRKYFENDLHAANTELNLKNTCIKELQGERDHLRRKIEEYKDILERIDKNYTKAIQNMQKDVISEAERKFSSTLHFEMEKLEQQIMNYKEKTEKYHKEIDNLKTELHLKMLKIMNLEKMLEKEKKSRSVQDFTTERFKIQRLEEDNKKLLQEKQEMKTTIINELDACKENLEGKMKFKQELNACKAELDEMSEQLSALQQENNTKATRENILMKENTSLTQECKDYEEEIKSLQMKKRSLEQKIKESELNIKKLQKEKRENALLLLSIETESNRYKKQFEEKQKELKDLQDEMKIQKYLEQELTQENSRLRKECQDLVFAYQTSLKKNQALEQRIQHGNNQVKDELKEKCKQVMDLQNENKVKHSLEQRLMEEKSHLQNELLKVRKELETIRDRNHVLEQSSLQENEGNTRKFHKRLQELSSENKQIQDEMKMEVARIKNERDSYKKILEEKMKQLKDFELEKQTQVTIQQNLDHKNAELETGIQSLQYDKRKIDERLKECEDIIERQNVKIDTLSRENKRIWDEKVKEIQRLKKECDQCKDQLTDLRQKEGAQISSSSSLQEHIACLEDEIKTLKDENVRLEHRHAEKDRKSNRRIDELSSEKKQIQDRSETEVARLKKECDQYKDQLTDLRQKEGAQIASASSLQEHIACLEDEIKTLKDENVHLEHRHAEKDRKSNRRIDELSREKKQIQDRSDTEVARLQKECDQYKDQLTDLRQKEAAQIASASSLKEQNARLEDEIKTLRDENFTLEQRFKKDYDQCKEQLKDLRQTEGAHIAYVNSLQEGNARLEEEIKTLRNDNVSLEFRYKQECDQYKAKLDDKIKQIKDLQKEKTVLPYDNSDEKKKLQAQILAFKKENSELQDKNHSLEQKIVEVGEKIEEKRDETHVLHQKYQDLQTEKNNMQAKLHKLETTEMLLLRNEKECIMKNEKKLREENEKLKNDNEMFRERIMSLEKIQKPSETTLQKTEDKIQEVMKRLEESEDKVRVYNFRIQELMREKEQFRAEKENALTRLSAMAGDRLRDNNAAIADLSDDNRPIKLGEKFSELYDNQWTDAMENLEEKMHMDESKAIQCLLNLIEAIYQECEALAINQLEDIAKNVGLHIGKGSMKKVKDFRKSMASEALQDTAQVVHRKCISVHFGEIASHCKTYINRSIELCWYMRIQDPPVTLMFGAKKGDRFDDKIYRHYTKSGSKIDFMVWPVMFLHHEGPVLQKGVVQPL